MLYEQSRDPIAMSLHFIVSSFLSFRQRRLRFGLLNRSLICCSVRGGLSGSARVFQRETASSFDVYHPDCVQQSSHLHAYHSAPTSSSISQISVALPLQHGHFKSSDISSRPFAAQNRKFHNPYPPRLMESMNHRKNTSVGLWLCLYPFRLESSKRCCIRG